MGEGARVRVSVAVTWRQMMSASRELRSLRRDPC